MFVGVGEEREPLCWILYLLLSFGIVLAMNVLGCFEQVEIYRPQFPFDKVIKITWLWPLICLSYISSSVLFCAAPMKCAKAADAGQDMKGKQNRKWTVTYLFPESSKIKWGCCNDDVWLFPKGGLLEWSKATLENDSPADVLVLTAWPCGFSYLTEFPVQVI